MDPAHVPFSAEDESKMRSAATWGSIVAITSIVGAAISLLVTIPQMMELPKQALYNLMPNAFAESFFLLINVFLLQACMAIRKVATTDEADQAYLLVAFRKLRLYFMIQVLVVVVSIGMVMLAGIAISTLF